MVVSLGFTMRHRFLLLLLHTTYDLYTGECDESFCIFLDLLLGFIDKNK